VLFHTNPVRTGLVKRPLQHMDCSGRPTTAAARFPDLLLTSRRNLPPIQTLSLEITDQHSVEICDPTQAQAVL
jgi:hypothetical protein